MEGFLSDNVRDIIAIIGIFLGVIQLLLGFILQIRKKTLKNSGATKQKIENPPSSFRAPLLRKLGITSKSLKGWLVWFFSSLSLMLLSAYFLKSLNFICLIDDNNYVLCSSNIVDNFIGGALILFLAGCGIVQVFLFIFLLVQFRESSLFPPPIANIADIGDGVFYYGAISLISLMASFYFISDGRLFRGNWFAYFVNVYLTGVSVWSAMGLIASTCAAVIEFYRKVIRGI